MENVFDHLFRFLKNFEVKAEPKTRKKKRWLLSREYLQPLDESDDENSGVIQDDSPFSGNAKLRHTYEAAKYGMKQGVLTGVFLGGSWGIFKNLNKNDSLHLSADSSEKVKDGESEKKDPEIDTRSYTIIQKDKSSQIDLDSEESVYMSKETPCPPTQNYQDVIRKNAFQCPSGNEVHAACIGNRILNKDKLSERQPCDPASSNRYGFRKPVEKVEIIGYAFIETTRSLNGTHSSSGSNQSDGSDSSGSATGRKNESKDCKKSMESPGRAENSHKNKFRKEENSTFEKTSQSSSGISDTIKHSVLSMAEKSIHQWRNIEQNESEIMSKVEPNQSQDCPPKWAEYSISSLPDILETSNFSPIDFEQDDRRRASLVKSLPRSASVLEETSERFTPVNLLSSTYSKSVEARSSKHRKNEIKWGKIFEKPRPVAHDYDSDHNFITSLKLSVLVDADTVSNGYDSDIAVNSTHAKDDCKTNTTKIGRKPVFAKKNSVGNPSRGLLHPKEAQDQSKNKAVSPKFFKASKTILKHNTSEKYSHELNKAHTYNEQNQSMLNIESSGYSFSFDEASDHFTNMVSSSDFPEFTETEFREQSSFGEGSSGLVGPQVTTKPDHHSLQGSGVKFSKSHAEEHYDNRYDMTDTENTRPQKTDKINRGYSKVDFVDNKSYSIHTTERQSLKESDSKFAKPRAEERYQSKYDLTDTISTRPHTTEKIDRENGKVTNNKSSNKAPVNNHSPNNLGPKFSRSRAEEQYQDKYDLVDTEDTRPHTTDKTDRGYNKVDFTDNRSSGIDTADRHSSKESSFKFDKSEIPKAQEQRKFTDSSVSERTNSSKANGTMSKTQSNYKNLKPVNYVSAREDPKHKSVPHVSTREDSHSPKDSDPELVRPRAEAKEPNRHSVASSAQPDKTINEEKRETITPALIMPEISETDQREYNEISSAYFGRRVAELPPSLTRRTSFGGGSKKNSVNFNENKELSGEEAGMLNGAQSTQRTDKKEKPSHSFNILSPLNENIIILSACNCAIVLGVICCVISATRATLSV